MLELVELKFPMDPDVVLSVLVVILVAHESFKVLASGNLEIPIIDFVGLNQGS